MPLNRKIKDHANGLYRNNIKTQSLQVIRSHDIDRYNEDSSFEEIGSANNFSQDSINLEVRTDERGSPEMQK